MTIADLVRLTLAGIALILAVTCGGGIVYARTWDQRGRFGVLLGYAAVITGGQLDTLGTPPTWRTWATLVVTIAAVILTAAFLIRHVRSTRGGPGDGRSADDQRRVFRARARARRSGDAGNGTQPPGGSPAP